MLPLRVLRLSPPSVTGYACIGLDEAMPTKITLTLDDKTAEAIAAAFDRASNRDEACMLFATLAVRHFHAWIAGTGRYRSLTGRGSIRHASAADGRAEREPALQQLQHAPRAGDLYCANAVGQGGSGLF
jgi:hypothetical protein